MIEGSCSANWLRIFLLICCCLALPHRVESAKSITMPRSPRDCSRATIRGLIARVQSNVVRFGRQRLSRVAQFSRHEIAKLSDGLNVLGAGLYQWQVRHMRTRHAAFTPHTRQRRRGSLRKEGAGRQPRALQEHLTLMADSTDGNPEYLWPRIDTELSPTELRARREERENYREFIRKNPYSAEAQQQREEAMEAAERKRKRHIEAIENGEADWEFLAVPMPTLAEDLRKRSLR